LPTEPGWSTTSGDGRAGGGRGRLGDAVAGPQADWPQLGAALIAEARAGALRLGRLGDEPGFHGLVVPIEEVENLAPRLATTDEEAILATGMSVKVH
jgi:hypothetical protein